MAKIKLLGALAANISRATQALYTPPSNTIAGIDPGQWPSPLQPVAPISPAGAQPLGWPFQMGANLTYTPRADAEYSASDLRIISKYPLARICIENVKDQLSRIPWQIQLRPNQGETNSERVKRGNKDANIKRLTAAFERPNPEQDYTDFVRRIVDDMLVIDAASIYKQRTKGNGKQIAYLRYLPGDNITRYIDNNGFTPQPPNPAYAQLWEGFPRVDLTTEQLLYRPRNIAPRVTYASYLYGFSPTEQLWDEILVGAMRLRYVLNFYQSGSVPGIVHVVPPGTDKSKILETMQWMNSEMAGQLEKRRQWRMIQGFNENKPDQILILKDPVLADVFDDLHIRKVCFGYGTSPQRLMRMMNRATANANQEAAEEEGMEPWKVWLKSVFDELIQQPSGYGLPQYEIALQSGQETDLNKRAQTDKVLISCGRATINEQRDAAGEDPSTDPMANRLGIVTATGFIPLTPTPEELAQQQEAQNHQQSGDTPAGPGKKKPQPQGEPAGGKGNKKVAALNGNTHSTSAVAVLDPVMDLWDGNPLAKSQSKSWIIDLDEICVIEEL